MHIFLLFGMNYVYEACNSTILNLSVSYEELSLGLLNYLLTYLLHGAESFLRS